jgi:uncharacterized membrane protein YecN with MAPEG domain
MTNIPIALGTAGFLGVLYVALSFRVTLVRWSAKVSIGDGAAPPVAFGKEREELSPLRAIIRSHANFAEYVPIALILLAGIEAAGASQTLCLILAAMLIIARIAHPIGMARKAPNPFRGGGAALTWAMILIAGLEALKLAL